MVLRAKKSHRDDNHKQAALDEAIKEEITRLNAEIPISLHSKVKIRAVQEGKGQTITSIVIKALEAYLKTEINEYE
jgi:hypothetical protein